jgi:hypothetical protein
MASLRPARVSCWHSGMEWPDCFYCGRRMQRVEVGHADFICSQCPVLFEGQVVDRFTRFEPA